ncbi:hypothetical protein P7K49_031284, partial [Saguinus oedipus]
MKPRSPPAFSRPLSQSPEDGTHICSYSIFGIMERVRGPVVPRSALPIPSSRRTQTWPSLRPRQAATLAGWDLLGKKTVRWRGWKGNINDSEESSFLASSDGKLWCNFKMTLLLFCQCMNLSYDIGSASAGVNP